MEFLPVKRYVAEKNSTQACQDGNVNAFGFSSPKPQFETTVPAGESVAASKHSNIFASIDGKSHVKVWEFDEKTKSTKSLYDVPTPAIITNGLIAVSDDGKTIVVLGTYWDSKQELYFYVVYCYTPDSSTPKSTITSQKFYRGGYLWTLLLTPGMPRTHFIHIFKKSDGKYAAFHVDVMVTGKNMPYQPHYFIVDTESGTMRSEFALEWYTIHGIWAFDISPDGNYLLGGGYAMLLYQWNGTGYSNILSIPAGKSWYYVSGAVTNAGTSVFTATHYTDMKQVCVRGIDEKGKILWQYDYAKSEDYDYAPLCLLSGDGRYAAVGTLRATGSKKGAKRYGISAEAEAKDVHVWDMKKKTKEPLFVYGLNDTVRCMDILHREKRLYLVVGTGAQPLPPNGTPKLTLFEIDL